MNEWPRSKFHAAATRQHRNFGYRNRIIGPYGIKLLALRSAAWGGTVQASPRTALILHRQDGEYPVLHSKPHVFSRKGQAIDPLRVLLIPGPGIAGQHAH